MTQVLKLTIITNTKQSRGTSGRMPAWECHECSEHNNTCIKLSRRFYVFVEEGGGGEGEGGRRGSAGFLYPAALLQKLPKKLDVPSRLIQCNIRWSLVVTVTGNMINSRNLCDCFSVLHDGFLDNRSKSLEFNDFAHSVREVSVTLLYVIFGRDCKEFCAVPQIFLDIFQEILTRFFLLSGVAWEEVVNCWLTDLRHEEHFFIF